MNKLRKTELLEESTQNKEDLLTHTTGSGQVRRLTP